MINMIETGFYTSGREKGSFFYDLTMIYGNTIHVNAYAGNVEVETDNCYLWLLELDEKIMDYSPQKVVNLKSEAVSYNYAEKYMDVFRKIMSENIL